MVTYVQLLGAAKAHLDSENIPFLADKRYLLLAYLAYKGDWVSREQLAYLFWPETSTQAARKNFRHLLQRTRALDFAEIESDGQQVRWLANTDLEQFHNNLAEGNAAEAIKHYQGELLEGIIPDLPEYADWLSQERESLHNAYREVVLSHSQNLEAQGQFKEAVRLLKQILNADLLAEDVVQAYMRCAYHSGQREQALKVFEEFRQLLREELDIKPLEATTVLANTIRQEPGPASLQTNAAADGPPTTPTAIISEQLPRLRNLPTQLTPFVGRDLDLSEIAGFFKEPDFRLLTLLGPGGIGKTRLAMQVAIEQVKNFADGITFVPLAAMSTSGGIAPAIASALGLKLSGNEAPDKQVIRQLEPSQMLLILDNLEHIIEGTGIILELLERCAKLRILVTSREALDFQGEWLFEVSGMDIPQADNSEHIEIHDAVKLFVRSTRRVHPRFALTPENKPFVAQICRMLQGSPLAIELATNWIRLLSVQEIAEEIQQSLGFLEASHPDLPERHRSLRAVFEHSWKLLSKEEQTALKKLSVFYGGFRKEAAQEVAEVALRTLLTLTNKSLLQRRPTGRFERHVIVREFSKEKLAQDKELYKEQQENHGLYYFDFIEARKMGGAKDQKYLQDIAEELENIRKAWNWASTRQRADQLERSADLVVFFDRQARFEEGARLFTEAIEPLNEQNKMHHAAIGKACVDTAWLYFRLGWYDRAIVLAERAVALLRSLDSSSTILMKALNTLSMVIKNMGDIERAHPYLTEALMLARKQGNAEAIANYLRNLAMIEQNLGHFQQAKEHNEEVLGLLQQGNDLFGAVITLNNLGGLNLFMLRLAEGEAHLQKGLQLAKEIGFQGIIPYLLSNLGAVAFKRYDYNRARALCLEALQAAKNIADSTVQATLFMTLGRTSTAIGNVSEAKNYFRQSLEIVWPIRELPIVMENVVGLAELDVKLGSVSAACELLKVAIHHPATESWFRRDAETLFESLQGQCGDRHIAVQITDEKLSSVISNVLSS